jgi:hypothetical protein
VSRRLCREAELFPLGTGTLYRGFFLCRELRPLLSANPLCAESLGSGSRHRIELSVEAAFPVVGTRWRSVVATRTLLGAVVWPPVGVACAGVPGTLVLRECRAWTSMVCSTAPYSTVNSRGLAASTSSFQLYDVGSLNTTSLEMTARCDAGS